MIENTLCYIMFLNNFMNNFYSVALKFIIKYATYVRHSNRYYCNIKILKMQTANGNGNKAKYLYQNTADFQIDAYLLKFIVLL